MNKSLKKRCLAALLALGVCAAPAAAGKPKKELYIPPPAATTPLNGTYPTWTTPYT